MTPPPVPPDAPPAPGLPLRQQPDFRRFWLSRLTGTAGHLVDRHERRQVLAIVLVAQTALVAALAGAWAAGWLGREMLLAVSLALGALRAFHLPARTRSTGWPRWASRRLWPAPCA